MVIPLRDNGPREGIAWVTLLIVLLNVAAFGYQLAAPGGPQALIDAWGIQPARLNAGGTLDGRGLPVWVTLLTAMYLHFDFMHIIGNMGMLWLLGDTLEWLCGRWRFFVFYHLCGLAASAVTWQLGGNSDLAGAGASGALAGVMGAYLLMFPRAAITCWVFLPQWGEFGLRDFSALWFIGVWMVMQVVSGAQALATLDAGPYGAYAHVAGAVAGMAAVYAARLPKRELERRQLAIPGTR